MELCCGGMWSTRYDGGVAKIGSLGKSSPTPGVPSECLCSVSLGRFTLGPAGSESLLWYCSSSEWCRGRLSPGLPSLK